MTAMAARQAMIFIALRCRSKKTDNWKKPHLRHI
jgi:hypothetical protein